MVYKVYRVYKVEQFELLNIELLNVKLLNIKNIKMKQITFTLATLFLIATGFAQTHIPGGTISGTWTKDGSPYLIEGMTWIEDGKTLIIEPGVVVEWQDSYTMFVQGQILAQGTKADSIIFTPADTAIGFRSIRFLDTPLGNDTSRFSYCVFRYGRVYDLFPDNSGGAILAINYGKFIVDHCLFDHNYADILNEEYPGGGAICLGTSSPVIMNSKFIYNKSAGGGAIICYDESHPLIKNNVFAHNSASFYGGAVMCRISSHPKIERNLFFSNTAAWDGGAIEIMESSSPKILNNTIVNNHAINKGGGFDMFDQCSPHIKNNILWGNIADTAGNQVYIYTDDCEAEFYYSDIEGGEDDFGGEIIQIVYEENINENPKFIDEDMDDYHLEDDSPCIDAGDPEMFDPDGSRIDIGAFYYQDVFIPIADFTADHTSIIEGDPVHFIDLSTYAESWEWVFEGGTPDTSSSQNPVVVYENYGIYDVQLIVSNSDGSDTLLISDYIEVEIDAIDHLNSFKIKIYPNPAKNELIIESEHPILSVQLINMGGQVVVLEKEIESRHIELNISQFQEGIYNLLIEDRKGVKIAKIVVLK